VAAVAAPQDSSSADSLEERQAAQAGIRRSMTMLPAGTRYERASADVKRRTQTLNEGAKNDG
jgi:hypothetical protein